MMRPSPFLTLLCFVVFPTVAPLLGQNLSKEFRAFTSSDGTFRVEAPADWKVMDLHDDGDIEIGLDQEEAIYYCLRKLRKICMDGILDKHSLVTLGNLLTSIDFPEIVGPVTLQINGHPALQYEIHGAAQGLSLSYIHTTVDSTHHFSQILMWTLKSRFEKTRPLFKKILSSFGEATDKTEAH